MPKTKQKILVTGCAGFIGFHICSKLISEGFFVYGIDNMNTYYDIDLKKKNSYLKIKIQKNFLF